MSYTCTGDIVQECVGSYKKGRDIVVVNISSDMAPRAPREAESHFSRVGNQANLGLGIYPKPEKIKIKNEIWQKS